MATFFRSSVHGMLSQEPIRLSRRATRSRARSCSSSVPYRQLQIVQLVVREIGHQLRSGTSNVRFAMSRIRRAAPRGRTAGSLARRTTVWRRSSCSSARRAPHRGALARSRGSAPEARRVSRASFDTRARGPADQVEARGDSLPEDRRQLLRLDQHILVHRDLAEVVQQRRKPQFAHLFAGVNRTSR